MDQVRQILQHKEDAEHRDGTVRMTTSQMGWPISEEAGESAGDRDGGEDRPTRRCIAPMISVFIRSQVSSDTMAEATARVEPLKERGFWIKSGEGLTMWGGQKGGTPRGSNRLRLD